MSTNTTVRAWSTTAASNNTADAAITSADTQSPDTLDDNIRTIMAAVKRQMNDIGGSLSAGGTANALTVTTGQVLESGQITDGLRILLKATADNTSATVTFAPDSLTAANIKRADGSALTVGAIKSGMYLDLVYNSGSSEWRAANISPAGVTAGIVYLTSGTVSAAATLDIVLTSYTTYRGLKFVLSGFLPATDGGGGAFNMLFSTNGGGAWIGSGYNYAISTLYDASSTQVNSVSGSAAAIPVTGASIGSASNEGLNCEVTLLNQSSTAFWPRATFSGYGVNSDATPAAAYFHGGGSNETAQDCDAVRFLFASGNISAGNYAVYGLV